MPNKKNFTQDPELRKRRRFSEEFKRQKVQEITSKMVTIAQISRQYQVRAGNIHKWINRYGPQNPLRGVRFIVEAESDTQKIADLQAKIAQLEQLVGQKEVLITFQNKLIETAENMYGVDIKKKLIPKLSSAVNLKVTDVEPKA